MMPDEGNSTKNLINAMEAATPGSLGISETRRLAGDTEHENFDFTFKYQGFLFAVRGQSESQLTHMQFRAHLGNLPYTGENSSVRANVFAVIREAGRVLGGRLSITDKQQIILAEKITIDEPLSPYLLVGLATRLILEADPYLKLLSIMVSPPVVNAARPKAV